tara:strand:+ start:195 stop:344 length:150 start_codon:yes stop_codon:yes gene_type:complete
MAKKDYYETLGISKGASELISRRHSDPKPENIIQIRTQEVPKQRKSLKL